MNQHATFHRNIGFISRRQCNIIACLAEGYTHEQIGEQIGLSESAVQQNLGRMMRRQGVHHTYELISWAYQNGFLK